MTVIISPDVIDYLENLVFTLRDKGHFNFLEDAEEYVDKIYDATLLHFNGNSINKLLKN